MFRLISGLAINTEKTNMIKGSPWRDSRTILCPKLKLDWTHEFKSSEINVDVLGMFNIT